MRTQFCNLQAIPYDTCQILQNMQSNRDQIYCYQLLFDQELSFGTSYKPLWLYIDLFVYYILICFFYRNRSDKEILSESEKHLRYHAYQGDPLKEFCSVLPR